MQRHLLSSCLICYTAALILGGTSKLTIILWMRPFTYTPMCSDEYTKALLSRAWRFASCRHYTQRDSLVLLSSARGSMPYKAQLCNLTASVPGENIGLAKIRKE